MGRVSSGDIVFTLNFKSAIMSKYTEFRGADRLGDMITDFRRPYTYSAR